VDPVGPDDQAEGLRRAAGEGDLHPGRGLGQRGDRVAEAVVAASGGLLVHDRGQVPAQDLDVAAGELAAHHGLLAAGRVQAHGVGPAGLPALDLVPDPHPLEHGPVGAALEVDGLAAGPRRGRLLGHGDVEAVPAEPVGQGGTGDAGPGDEDVLVAHEVPP